MGVLAAKNPIMRSMVDRDSMGPGGANYRMHLEEPACLGSLHDR